MTEPRENRLSWDETFMVVATAFSMRSADPSTQVGACIVNKDNRIVATGYNGFPAKCEDYEGHWSWSREQGDPDEWLTSKYPYVVHGEMNAILNATVTLKDCKLYTAYLPCNDCMKAIIQAGIIEVVYSRGPDVTGSLWLSHQATEQMAKVADVKLTQYEGRTFYVSPIKYQTKE